VARVDQYFQRLQGIDTDEGDHAIDIGHAGLVGDIRDRAALIGRCKRVFFGQSLDPRQARGCIERRRPTPHHLHPVIVHRVVRGGQPCGVGRTLRHDLPELGQVTTEGIDGLRPLPFSISRLRKAIAAPWVSSLFTGAKRIVGQTAASQIASASAASFFSGCRPWCKSLLTCRGW